MATTDDGALVLAARAGDQLAFGRLFDAWFDRAHDLSRRIVHDDGVAAEVAQDAFLTAWTKLATLEDPDAFGGWLLRITRNRSLNRLAKERRSTTPGDEAMTAASDALAPDPDPLASMDQAARVALVWEAAAALGERDASVLDLHLRHGLTPAELADELGVTANNAHQILFTLRKRLGASVRALVLWRAGRPTCPALGAELAAAGLGSFGGPMVKAIDGHVARCEDCARDRTERVSPAALFAAAPIVMAPVLLKAQAASALEVAGVPMAGSTATGAAGGGGAGGAGGLGSAGSASGAGLELVGPAAADDAGRAHHPARKVLAMAAVFLLVLGVATGVVLATRAGHDEVRTVADRATTTAAAPATTSTPVAPPATAVPTPGGPGATTPVATDRTGTTLAPATTAGPTVVAPTTAPVPPPTIDTFTADPTSELCGNDVIWALTWSTTDATSVTVGRTDGKGVGSPVDGKTSICAPSGTTFFLNAEGPGGLTSATAGGQAAPTTTTTTIVIG